MTVNLSIKNWSRRVKNAAAALLFLTAYTISAVGPFVPVASATSLATLDLCTNDVQGVNDEPGQKDLTRFCKSSDNPSESITISWNWDETGWTGSNTGDACALFDTDDAGSFVDYAVCVTVSGDPATQTGVSPRVYSCTNGDIDNCTGATLVSPMTTSCSVSQTPTDPFSGSGKLRGADYPNDTTAVCTIVLADVGGAALKDVCSYPSQQPTSDPSGCIITPTKRTPSATIEVIKVINPGATGDVFNLSVDGPGADDTTTANDQGDGGTTGPVEIVIPQGNDSSATVSETAGTNTSLSDYTSSISCLDRVTTNVIASGQGTSLIVPISDKDDIVCTITNTRSMGYVKVIKDVVNDNGGTKTYADFSFDVNGQNYKFNPTTSPDGERTVPLPTGTYSVTEPEANTMGYSTSYSSTSYSGCTDIVVVADQTATCTITNDDIAPSLTLNKALVKDNGGTASESDWTLTADGGNAGTLSGSGAAGDTDVVSGASFKAGTYALSESGGPDGYSASDWSCIGDGTQDGSNIMLGLGQSAVCTITNDDDAPSLTLKKLVNINYGGTAVASDWTLIANGPTTFQAVGSEAGSTTPDTFSTGIYTLSEAPTGDPILGYVASAWDCGNKTVSNNQIQIDLGDTVTCQITNSDTPASISGFKFEVNADKTIVDGDKDDANGITGLPGWTICLDANNNGLCDDGEKTTTTEADGSYSFTGLGVGEYGLLESNNLGGTITGWTQIFAPQPVSLSLGDDSENNDFGNFKNGIITGYKWNDEEGDRKVKGNDKLSGWGITLTGETDEGEKVSRLDTTDAEGNYIFENVAPGTYEVCEVMQPGWVQTYPGTPGQPECHDAVIDESGEVLNNKPYSFGNQGRGAIEVIKHVDTDGDGKVDVHDTDAWSWDAGGDTYKTGTSVRVAAGEYTVTEHQQENFHFTAVRCYDGDEQFRVVQEESVKVTVEPGSIIKCHFVNTRDTAHITVKKLVINNNSGKAEAKDFELYVNDTRVRNGAENRYLTDVEYTVSEIIPDDLSEEYNQVGIYCWIDRGVEDLNILGFERTQRLGSTFTLERGKDVKCVVKNDDVAHPKINIEKSGPEAAHEGDTVTYMGTITNTGDAPLHIVGVEDDVAGAVTLLYDGGYPVGDENENYLLDLDETWYGEVKYTIPEGQVDDIVNTMKVCADDATGWQKAEFGLLTQLALIAEGQLTGDDCSTDDHTLDVLHPALMVVKEGPVNAQLGTSGTFTFTVSNTGDVALDLTTVEDSIAGMAVYQSGDTNDDGMLDLDEVWIYTAEHTFTQLGTIKNVVTVCGFDPLELEVCGEDDHTTIVYQPQVLAETGLDLAAPFFLSTGFLGLAFATLLHRRKYSEDIR